VSTSEFLLSLPAYVLWFGPLLALLVWAIWKLAHTFHHAAPTTEVAGSTSREHHGTPPSIAPLAHG